MLGKDSAMSEQTVVKYNKKIEVVDGLFNENELKYLYSPKRKMSYGWQSNPTKGFDPGHWNYVVAGYTNPDHEIGNEDCQYSGKFLSTNLKDVWKKVKKHFGDRNVLRCYFNGYTFGTEGYIHKDQTKTIPGHKQETILVFCTKEWKADWAGETQFFTEDQKNVVYSTLPLPNRVVCFNSSIPHVGRSVSRCYPGLRTIVAFKTSVFEIDMVKCFSFIKEKTESIKHSNTTFWNHLGMTFELLSNMGLPEYVCVAGLFHAIYGTEFFKHNELESITRDEIKILIGERAEALVYSFGTRTFRTRSLINEANNNPGDVNNYFLLCIEYCNLLEQLPRMTGDNSKMREIIEELRLTIEGYCDIMDCTQDKFIMDSETVHTHRD